VTESDSERWRRTQGLFHRLRALPVRERRTRLRELVPEDRALAAEVLELLEEDARDGSALDDELPVVASRVLDGSVPSVLRFGPYRVIRILGHGGMGVVYLAERPVPRMQVAVKVLRDAALSPARRERFVREQQLLAHLEHPSIARLYDTGVLEDGTPYFVMEYVDGLPLHVHADEHGLDIPARLALFRGVCDAVQYAHRRGVIHRDLKPSNVLVAASAGRGDATVKLLDFGVAKRVEELTRPSDLTGAGVKLLTAAYAAPEQLRGEPAGVYSDVFALGVILYELLTGRVPFDLSRTTPAEAERLVVGQQPEPPSARCRSAPRGSPVRQRAARVGAGAWSELDTICATAMRKDPQERYPSVEALIRDLEHYRKGQPLEARPASAGYRLRKFVRRHRAAAVASVAAMLVVVAFTAVVAVQSVRVGRERDRANREAAAAGRVSRFLIDMFRVADPMASRGGPGAVRELVDEAVRKLGGGLDEHPLARAAILGAAGEVYRSLGLLQDAEPLLQDARDARTTWLGPDHPDTLRATRELGELYTDMSLYEQAEALLAEAYRGLRGLLGRDDPDALRAGRLLATVYAKLARFEEAEALLDDVLARQERTLPPGHEQTVASAAQLGGLYRRLGRHDEAEALYRRYLDLLRRHAPENVVDRSTLLHNLGIVLTLERRYDDARATLEQAIATKRALFGAEHPEVLRTRGTLGAVYEYMGRVDRAGEIYEEVLEAEQALYEPDHEDRLATLQNLAGVRTAQGRFDEAETLYRRALEGMGRTVGEDHPHTMQVRHNLALLYARSDRLREAEVLFRQVQESWERSLGPEHPYVHENLAQWARALREAGRDAEAAALEARAARLAPDATR
jgi:serine/threonine protein kinase/tetratricopeptide (TPR) repeat protein